ncbi:hypothetical protein ACEPAI_2055 [Sanghuangporus weigelae]
MSSTTSKKRSYEESPKTDSDMEEEPKKVKRTDSELDAERSRYGKNKDKAGKAEQEASDKQSRVKFKD